MIACPNCHRGLTFGEYLFSRGKREPGDSAWREFGFYTCPQCGAHSTKPRVVLHAWAQVIAAALGLTGLIPFWAWAGAAVALFALVATRPKMALLPRVPES